MFSLTVINHALVYMVTVLLDLNCSVLYCTVDVCGLYAAGDVTMENLQANCEAFKSSTTCADKAIRLEKLKFRHRRVIIFTINFHKREYVGLV